MQDYVTASGILDIETLLVCVNVTVTIDYHCCKDTSITPLVIARYFNDDYLVDTIHYLLKISREKLQFAGASH